MRGLLLNLRWNTGGLTVKSSILHAGQGSRLAIYSGNLAVAWSMAERRYQIQSIGVWRGRNGCGTIVARRLWGKILKK